MSVFGPRAGGLRLIRIVLIAVAVAVVMTSVGGVFLFASNRAQTDDIRALSLQARRDAEVSRSALCALRTDMERRVATSKALIARNPQGFAGIPARTIRDGIRNQERTIRALSSIDCK